MPPASPAAAVSITRQLTSLKDCTRSMDELLDARLEVERLTAQRDSKVRDACGRFDKDIEISQKRAAKQEAALEDYYLTHRKEIEQEGQKFLQLPNGRIGCTLSAPKLVTLAKWTWDKVLEKLESIWPGEYVRTHDPEVDKVAVKAAKLTTDGLRTCGLAITQTETFYADPSRPPDPGRTAA